MNWPHSRYTRRRATNTQNVNYLFTIVDFSYICVFALYLCCCAINIVLWYVCMLNNMYFNYVFVLYEC